MNRSKRLMNQLNRSVSKQGLLRKQVETFGLRKVFQPLDTIQLMLLYHPTKGDCLTSILQNHFVGYSTSIADELDSVQQPPQDVWLSGEIVLCGSAA